MDFYNNSFYLQPQLGDWNTYSDHTQVIDAIFEAFMPFVHEGSYQYLNFRRDTSVFENELGDYLLIVYDMNDKDYPRIQEILVEIEKRDSAPSQKMLFILQKDIQIPFRLIKVNAI